MKLSRYDDSVIGKVISMRCRRSLNNREVIVIDNGKLSQVYVYDHDTVEGAIAFLQDEMHLDIRALPDPPLRFQHVHHEESGYLYQVPHEEDDTFDDFHAFFAPQES